MRNIREGMRHVREGVCNVVGRLRTQRQKKKKGSKQYHHNSSVERDVLAVALAVRWTEALTVNGCDVCGSSISVGLL